MSVTPGDLLARAQRTRTLRRRRAAAIPVGVLVAAALIAGAALAAGLVGVVVLMTPSLRYGTGLGEIRQVPLSDGSLVADIAVSDPQAFAAVAEQAKAALGADSGGTAEAA